MPFATASDATRLHYQVHGARQPGDACPVVLLHGFGLSSRFWFGLPALIANDATSPRQVITIDNRGTGRSDRPRRPYVMTGLADDVAAVLDDAGLPEGGIL